MTISPPANVIHYQILASGIDTLVLAIDVTWQDKSLFDYLSQMKSLAIEVEKDVAAIIRSKDDDELWACNIKPYGTKGYEWILVGNDYTLTIGNWTEPKSRPCIMAEIRSETLWRIGPYQAVNDLKHILVASGAGEPFLKVSRVDLCLDFTFPAELWNADLVKFRVTRASYAAPHFFNADLTGISIGKGHISARLYDKPQEIRQKSKKIWMYDIWGVESVPDDLKIIRTEGQFRREGIKELGIDKVEDLFKHLDNVWAYFTQKWLKFQNNPGEHPNLRKTFPWWGVIQDGFLGIQGATPLIRCKSLATKKQQLFAQTYGTLNSMIAIDHEEKLYPLQEQTSLEGCMEEFIRYAALNGKNEFELNIDILNKRGKYHRHIQKMDDVEKQRADLNHPSNLPLNKIIFEQQERRQWQENTSRLLNSIKDAKTHRGQP